MNNPPKISRGPHLQSLHSFPVFNRDPVPMNAERSTTTTLSTPVIPCFGSCDVRFPGNNPHADLFTPSSHQTAGIEVHAGQASKAVPEWCMFQSRLNRRRRAQATASRRLIAHLFALALGFEQKASLIPISWRRTRIGIPIHIALLGTCSTPAHRSHQLAPVAICRRAHP